MGKFEKMAIAPVTPFSEVDDWLYGLHFPEVSTNRSHVADADLNKLLIAQRRELDPKRRRELVEELERARRDYAGGRERTKLLNQTPAAVKSCGNAEAPLRSPHAFRTGTARCYDHDGPGSPHAALVRHEPP